MNIPIEDNNYQSEHGGENSDYQILKAKSESSSARKMKIKPMIVSQKMPAELRDRKFAFAILSLSQKAILIALLFHVQSETNSSQSSRMSRPM